MKKLSVIISLFILISYPFSVQAQTIKIDAAVEPQQPQTGHLKMGNPGSKGKELQVNSKYLTMGGEPIIPVMGEVHYTRIKRENWEDVILKMKANGINIIAYYIFWINHEEIEGQFEWKGNNDVRAFTELIQKHGLYAYPRLGPWNHGEVRNGGLPDWLMQKEGIKLRSNDTAYQTYAENFYKEISEQLKGLYYKDGGPIIGVQLENEYWRGKGGEEHILWLKQIALKYGLDVPMYTITGWRNTSLPPYEVIPLWGGYPSAPWNTDLNKIETNESYIFQMPLNDQSIGNRDEQQHYQPDYTPYPYLTCELGIGNQLSEHRRPTINPMDGMAIAISNLASGSNLPGYYVFAGGLNPVGKRTTLEENKLETGEWNEYPDISYDFQAAISEAGEIKPAYHKVKTLHYFLNEYGNLLAPMQPVTPKENTNWDDLQYSFRTDGKSGFLFISNYYRGHAKSTKKKVQFDIKLKSGEKLSLPSKPMDILDSTVCIWPVNFQLGDIQLKYATAQPICDIAHGDTTDFYFKKTRDIVPEFLFDKEEVTSVFCQHMENTDLKNSILIKAETLGVTNPIVLITKENKVCRIFTLSESQSDKFWYFKVDNTEYAFLSGSNLTVDEKGQLNGCSIHSRDTLVVLAGDIALKNSITETGNINDFKIAIVRYPGNNLSVEMQPSDIINDAIWLSLKGNRDNSLYNKQFYKSFKLENTAEIRKATLYIFSGVEGKIRVNSHWVNQDIPDHLNAKLDLTGYLKIGTNSMFLNFPSVNSDEAFIAVLEVEYYNSDKEYITTNNSWLTAEQYKIPAPWESMDNFRTVVRIEKPATYPRVKFAPYRYAFYYNPRDLADNQNAYLRLKYNGNKAQCRLGKNLVADNFNRGTVWTINLSNIDNPDNLPIYINLEPWQGSEKVYIENKIDFTPEKTGIRKIMSEVENKSVLGELKK